MLLKIDLKSDTPIYIQLKNQIIEGIANGELKAEEGLPSVRQLAEDIGINMHTVSKVYNQLKDMGFITIHKRKGVIISTPEEMQKNNITEELKESLKPIIAEAYCKGMQAEEFSIICKEIFSNYERR